MIIISITLTLRLNDATPLVVPLELETWSYIQASVSARIRPTIAAAMIFPATILERFTGRVSSVSRVLFSFSRAMDDITICPAIIIIIIIIIGINVDCWERAVEIWPGEIPFNSFFLKYVVSFFVVGFSAKVELIEPLPLLISSLVMFVLTVLISASTTEDDMNQVFLHPA